MESWDSGDLIPLAALPPPAPCEGQQSERMNTADKEKGVREKNGGTREVSYIQTNILNGDNRMGGVCV